MNNNLRFDLREIDFDTLICIFIRIHICTLLYACVYLDVVLTFNRAAFA